MKLIFFILVVVGIFTAFNVIPDYSGVHDTGDDRFDTMVVNLWIDCNTKELTAEIKEESGTPIMDAKTYVFYTNYGYQLISTGKTDDTGVATMDIEGNMNYLTALFIFRADHSNFQSREIEFTYEKCFGPEPTEPVYEPPRNDEPPEPQNQSQDIWSDTDNSTYLTNATGQTDANNTASDSNSDENEDNANSGGCMSSAILGSLILLGVVIRKI